MEDNINMFSLHPCMGAKNRMGQTSKWKKEKISVVSGKKRRKSEKLERWRLEGTMVQNNQDQGTRPLAPLLPHSLELLTHLLAYSLLNL